MFSICSLDVSGHSSIKELLPPGRGPVGVAQQCPVGETRLPNVLGRAGPMGLVGGFGGSFEYDWLGVSYESCGSGWDEGLAGFGGSCGSSGSCLSCGFCGFCGSSGLYESAWLSGSVWYSLPNWANSGYFLYI